MKVAEAKAELEKFVALKTTMRPAFVDALLSVEEPAQWIPITEALPKTDDMVLVTCVTKSGLKSVNRAYCDERGFWHGLGSMAGVVAWLPLPKPYEGV